MSRHVAPLGYTVVIPRQPDLLLILNAVCLVDF